MKSKSVDRPTVEQIMMLVGRYADAWAGKVLSRWDLAPKGIDYAERVEADKNFLLVALSQALGSPALPEEPSEAAVRAAWAAERIANGVNPWEPEKDSTYNPLRAALKAAYTAERRSHTEGESHD